MAVINVTSDNYEKEVVNNEKPVVLDFWAVWCGPCQMQGPVIDQTEAAHGERIAFAKVNVDEQPVLAEKFGIMSIPTLVVLNQGQVVTKAVGFQSQEEILKLIP